MEEFGCRSIVFSSSATVYGVAKDENAKLKEDLAFFEGFIPVKKGRKTRLEQMKLEYRTIVMYESPYKLLTTLKDLALALGDDSPR